MKFIYIAKLGVFCLAVLPLPWLAAEERSIDVESRTTVVPHAGDRPIRIAVYSRDGDIEIRGEERDSVEVVIERFDPRDDDRRRARIDYDPGDASLKLKLYGDLKESNLKLTAPSNAVLQLRTEDGNIELSDCFGEIEVSSVDGNIRCERLRGPAAVHTVDGDILLRMAASGTLHAISAATVDGDIVLIIPKGVGAEVDASGIDGDFNCEVPLTMRHDSGLRKRDSSSIRIKAIVNGGGPRISLKAIDGDITIREEK